jgi:hypothetical protein
MYKYAAIAELLDVGSCNSNDERVSTDRIDRLHCIIAMLLEKNERLRQLVVSESRRTP